LNDGYGAASDLDDDGPVDHDHRFHTLLFDVVVVVLVVVFVFRVRRVVGRVGAYEVMELGTVVTTAGGLAVVVADDWPLEDGWLLVPAVVVVVPVVDSCIAAVVVVFFVVVSGRDAVVVTAGVEAGGFRVVDVVCTVETAVDAAAAVVVGLAVETEGVDGAGVVVAADPPVAALPFTTPVYPVTADTW
jgi:hypothetical protein